MGEEEIVFPQLENGHTNIQVLLFDNSLRSKDATTTTEGTRFKSTRVTSNRDLRADNSASPATLNVICFLLQIRALDDSERMFRLVTGRS